MEVMRDGASTVQVMDAVPLSVLPGAGCRAAKVTWPDDAGEGGVVLGAVVGGVVASAMMGVARRLGVAAAPPVVGAGVIGAVVGIAVTATLVDVGDTAAAGDPQAASKTSETAAALSPAT